MSLPAPERTDLPTESRPYYVGPFDKLVIDVYGIPELSKRDVQVDAAGKVSFPLAGVMEVAGKTITTYAGGLIVLCPKTRESVLNQLRGGETPSEFDPFWLATEVGDE